MTWAPIETAPRDGTPVLLFSALNEANEQLVRLANPDEVKREQMTTGWWDVHYAEWRLCVAWGWDAEENPYYAPTHWASLPEPPK